MISVSVKSNVDQARRSLALKRSAIDNATRRAVNKTAEQVMTEAKKQIGQERNLPKSQISKALSLKRANYANLTARITATGRPISLKHYGAKGPRGRPKKQRIQRDSRGRFIGGTGSPPITVEIIKGRRKVIKGGFFGPNDHVYRRRGKSRTPIDVLFGPSISSAMAKRIVNQAMVTKVRATFPRLLQHELTRI